MANQYYKLINTPTLEINEVIYHIQEYPLTLEEFLVQNVGKDIYILSDSILNYLDGKSIKAIVI